MFDIGWSEILLVGCVSLVVIGDRDWPVVLRSMGRFVANVRMSTAGLTRAFLYPDAVSYEIPMQNENSMQSDLQVEKKSGEEDSARNTVEDDNSVGISKEKQGALADISIEVSDVEQSHKVFD
jgi:sec-independent protein translocase protein TatB